MYKSMKISKITLVISFIIVIVLMVLVGQFAYSFGQHRASLTVKEATPKQLAEAMQSDNFWGDYPKMMLLVKGNVISVNRQNNDTVVGFMTTSSPSVLPTVSCDLGNNQTVKTGDTITILSVAYDAERKNSADVFMSNCYLLKQ